MSHALVITPWSHAATVDQLRRLGRHVAHRSGMCHEARFEAYLAALLRSLRQDNPAAYPTTTCQQHRAEELHAHARQFMQAGQWLDALSAVFRALAQLPYSTHLCTTAGLSLLRLDAKAPAGYLLFQALWLDGDNLDARLAVQALPPELRCQLLAEIFGPPQ